MIADQIEKGAGETVQRLLVASRLPDHDGGNREDDTRPGEAGARKNVMDEEPMHAAVAVREGMNEDESERNRRRQENRREA